MKKLQKYIKQKDVFGHAVNLKFSKDSDTHKTLLGGCLSILMMIALFEIVLNKTIVMVTRDNIQITFYSEYYDIENGEGIYLNETNLFVYHILKK
jgi:hypothetical protein